MERRFSALVGWFDSSHALQTKRATIIWMGFLVLLAAYFLAFPLRFDFTVPHRLVPHAIARAGS